MELWTWTEKNTYLVQLLVILIGKIRLNKSAIFNQADTTRPSLAKIQLFSYKFNYRVWLDFLIFTFFISVSCSKWALFTLHYMYVKLFT